MKLIQTITKIRVTKKFIKSFKKEFLLGIHIRKGGKLPSGEKISTVIKKVEKHKPIGIILSCVSIEDVAEVFKDLKKIKCP